MQGFPIKIEVFHLELSLLTFFGLLRHKHRFLHAKMIPQVISDSFMTGILFPTSLLLHVVLDPAVHGMGGP